MCIELPESKFQDNRIDEVYLTKIKIELPKNSADFRVVTSGKTKQKTTKNYTEG